MTEHWFWWFVTIACLGWYSTVTVYVAIKGVFDIQRMLAALSRKENPVPTASGKPQNRPPD